MRRISTIAIICCAFFACGRADGPAEKPLEPTPPPAETPKALQDKSSFEAEIKSSSRGDMVEALYQELVKNDPALTDLEARLGRLPAFYRDSTEAFDSYMSKSDAYYSSAKAHISNIKDSVLRQKIERLIAASDTAYQALTAGHRALLADIEMKNLSISDIHDLLKLTTTAPVIERYQKSHLTGMGPLQYLDKECGQLQQKLKGMSKQ